MLNVFFAGWAPLGRILVVGTLSYVALVVLLRISGKRTLAQMSSFDFVITIAVGATFGRVLTARSVALAEAVTAFALLIVLQYVVTQLQIRWPSFAKAVTAAPTLLAYEGHVLPDALRRERLTPDELAAALRKHGHTDLEQALAVVMESDGTLAVISSGDRVAGRALEVLVPSDAPGAPAPRRSDPRPPPSVSR